MAEYKERGDGIWHNIHTRHKGSANVLYEDWNVHVDSEMHYDITMDCVFLRIRNGEHSSFL